MLTKIETPEKSIHSKYRLGRSYVVVDSRTFLLSKYLKKALAPAPFPFDVDSKFPKLSDNFMFGNDSKGDCVIAGRAHWTLRAEDFEQNLQIVISDSDVLKEYFKETGGPDSGLDMITSLNEWRQTGWTAAGKSYTIYAYAEIDIQNKQEVQDTLYYFNGIYAGVTLPISAQSQTGPGLVWDVDNGPNGDPGSWGGHCVYCVSLNETGPVCVTWGARQQMTWAFWFKYFDQAFAVIDNIDSWVDPATNPLNITELSNDLSELTNQPIPPSTSGTINLTVTPAGATIYLDGSFIPGQPSSFQVNPGQYTISAKLKGYKSAQQTITVISGQVYNVTLNLKKSGLCIFS